MSDIQLKNIDCMEYMASLPDSVFDLAIVDPQYSWNSGNGFTSRLKRYGDLSYNEKRPTPEYFKELRRVSKNQIIWGGNYFLSDLDDTKCMIFWHKRQPVKTYAPGEIAWTSFKDKHCAIFDYQYFGSVNSDVSRQHPNQKPIKLYEWILKTFSGVDQRILDTHLGSGSSAIAAHYFGCDFVGCEINPDYYAAACRRFKDETSQLSLLTQGV